MVDFSKATYKKALATIIGIETIVGKGPTGKAGRKALDTSMRAFVRTGRIVAPVLPPLARAVGRTAVANPLLTAGILGTAAYQGGYLDPAIQRAQEESFRAQENLRRLAMESEVQQAYERAGRPTFGEAAEQLVSKPVRRKVSKYSKAVKAGMAAVKSSKFGGKKGTISNAKSAFKTVNLVASAVNRGKKVAKTGIRGVVARAVRRIL